MAISSSSRGLRPGVCTSTTRPSNPYDGMVIYETDTDKVAVYDVNAWVYKTGTSHIAPALVLVKTQTIGTTVSSVTVTDAFSATYDAYKIVISGGVGSTSQDLGLQLGSSNTGYFAYQQFVLFSTGAVNVLTNNNASSFSRIGSLSTNVLSFSVELVNPFLSKFTLMQSSMVTTQDATVNSGYHGVASSFSAFTITPGGGTLTGGTIRVYGYQNS